MHESQLRLRVVDWRIAQLTLHRLHILRTHISPETLLYKYNGRPLFNVNNGRIEVLVRGYRTATASTHPPTTPT